VASSHHYLYLLALSGIYDYDRMREIIMEKEKVGIKGIHSCAS